MKLKIKNNFDGKHWPCRYAIYDDDEVPRTIFAYTNDTEIFDNLAEPDVTDYETESEYEDALERHRYAVEKAAVLYEEAVAKAEEEKWSEKYVIRERESGDLIDYFDTLEEAQAELSRFIEYDKRDGYADDDFYEIVFAEIDNTKFGNYRNAEKL